MVQSDIVQLIQKVKLRSSMWMTFWLVEDRSQFSVQFNDPAPLYDVGEVFTFKRPDTGSSQLSFVRYRDQMDETALPVPRNRRREKSDVVTTETALKSTARLTAEERRRLRLLMRKKISKPAAALFGKRAAARHPDERRNDAAMTVTHTGVVVE